MHNDLRALVRYRPRALPPVWMRAVLSIALLGAVFFAPATLASVDGSGGGPSRASETLEVVSATGAAQVQTVNAQPNRSKTIKAVPADWRSRLLSVTANPTVAYLLVLIGIYGIVFEIVTPGVGIPGIGGAVALIIGLFAINGLPVNYASAGLLLTGIALMIAEAFVTSFGVFGITGTAFFVAGSIFLLDGSVPELSLPLPVILCAAVASLVLMGVVLASVVRAHRRKVVSGDESIVGGYARVLSWSSTKGVVEFQGVRWQATSTGHICVGTQVTILRRQGLKLEVTPCAPTTPKGENSCHTI